ncbi:MAG: hypothetical protein KDD53_00715, partial [Bdellovibrionales bacterium]|nr:hypothetical protein [Bdellovibrionales bacterium]
MNRIRIANSRFYSSLAFREVASLDWVEYTEATPQENAQALHEGLVDLAHIPVSEFAMHGGYVGIDFGVSTVKQIDSVMLFAQQPIDKLKTIYLDAGASTSVVLLQLLLAEKWMLTPKMLRVERQSLLESVGGTNGVLIIGDAALSCRDKFPVAIDLTSVWYQLTGLPFVYTIWAKRPGTLSKEQGRCIDELFHRHAKIRTTLATRYHNEVHVPMPDALHYIERIKHYLDDSTIQGLNEFISRAARLKLLPDCRYKTARYNILNNRAAKLRRRTSVNDLLERSVEGKRLGIHDGMRLAEEASLADLGLIADLLRTRLFATRSVSVAYRPDIT